MWADVHLHLDSVPDVKGVLERAEKENVQLFFSNSANLRSMEKTLELQRAFPQVKACLGLYPGDVLQLTEKEIELALQFARAHAEECAGFGEVGLDFKLAVSLPQQSKQLKVFEQFISLAKEFNKPLEVHSRGARAECLKILREKGAGKVLLHFFSGSKAQARQVQEAGFFVSANCSALYNNWNDAFFQSLSLENLLLESDAPMRVQGNAVEPFLIPKLGEKIALLKEVSLSELESKITLNSEKLFENHL
ncbi:MAG: TatD family hydrolase [Candidatus Diapherotrites archaeon]